MRRDLLGIYLNDHLAGATGGVYLARRAALRHRRDPNTLRRLSEEVEEDRDALVRIMGVLDVPVRRYKTAAGWLAERVGRFKSNGRFIARSPLSDVLELEALRLGVEGKAAGWRLLRRLADDDDRLDAVELDKLIDRAHHQAQTLQDLHLQAAADNLASGPT